MVQVVAMWKLAGFAKVLLDQIQASRNPIVHPASVCNRRVNNPFQTVWILNIM